MMQEQLFTERPILVIGAGSIGERHIGILQQCGFKNIYVLRQRNLPLRSIDSNSIKIITDFSLLASIKPLAAVICSPTSLHAEQAIECLENDMHVLVEKPLCNGTDDIAQLVAMANQKQKLLQVAYMLRYHPAMMQIKECINTCKYGQLLSFQTYWGDYLPAWHPWEDYRKSYAARKELGGGVALTLSHDIDIVNWWLSSLPVWYKGLANFASPLEVNVESGADFLLKYSNGVTGHVHLNFYQQAPKRTYQLTFSEGCIEYDYLENLLTVKTKHSTEHKHYDSFERNDMFRDQTLDFFNKISNFNTEEIMAHTTLQIDESVKIVEMCNSMYH